MNADKQRIRKWVLENSRMAVSENRFVGLLRRGNLGDAQIVVVLDAIDATCPVCWDGEPDCKCWNDE